MNSSIQEGYQARREGRPDDAARLFEQAIAGSQGAQLAQALKGRGQIYRDQGQTDRAIQHYEQAEAIERPLGDLQRIAHTIRHLADMHREQGHLSRAEPYYQEALQLYRNDAETSRLDLANTLRGYALMARDAKPLWQEARDLYAAVGVDQGVKECEQHLTPAPPSSAA